MELPDEESAMVEQMTNDDHDSSLDIKRSPFQHPSSMEEIDS